MADVRKWCQMLGVTGWQMAGSCHASDGCQTTYKILNWKHHVITPNTGRRNSGSSFSRHAIIIALYFSCEDSIDLGINDALSTTSAVPPLASESSVILDYLESK